MTSSLVLGKQKQRSPLRDVHVPAHVHPPSFPLALVKAEKSVSDVRFVAGLAGLVGGAGWGQGIGEGLGFRANQVQLT